MREQVIDFRVEVKELRYRDGNEDVVEVDVDGFNTAMKQATTNQGLGTVIILFFSLAGLTTTDAMCIITSTVVMQLVKYLI